MKSRRIKTARLVMAAILGFSAFVSEAFGQSRPINSFRVNSFASLPSNRYDDYDLEKYEGITRDADRRLSDARSNLDRLERDLDLAQRRESQLNQNIQNQGRQLEQNRRREAELQRAIQQNQEAVSQAEQALPRLQNELSSLQGQVNSTTQVIQDLKNKLAGATTDEEKQAISKQIEAQSQVLNNLNSQVTAKNNEISQTNSRLNQARTNLNNNGRELEKSVAESSRLETQINDLRRQQESARREVLERQRARDIASSEYQSRSREVETARRNLEIVRSNIETARRILADQGADQGSMDGQREGVELGNSRGSNDGNIAGTNDGRARGTADGQKRDYDTGYAQGQAQATTDATNKSNTDAQVNGQRDGIARGKTDGLANAYKIGKEEGLKHGAETGDDREAYGQGRKEGEAAGLAKAVEDAKPQEGIGYTDKENEYLNAPLKSVVVGDQALADKFKGLQGRYSQEGDDRYYRPQPGILPHPRLERFYLESYDNAYRTELSTSYRSSYRSSYDSSYASSYRRLYDENYSRSYPESQKAGYNTGYNDTYQNVYDANYRVRYNAVYTEFYNKTYEQFKLDPAERARGFKDGNRIASREKGYNEGHAAAYAANIDIEKRKAYAAGQARAKALYDNNPVIKLSAIELREVDADGINRPGENLAVVMKLKNFGLKAKADLSSVMSDAQGAISVAQASVVTGTVPPQSDATVFVPVQSSVARSAVDGNSLQVLVKAQTGQTVHMAQRLALAVQYPSKVTVVGFDGILIPGLKTPVKLEVFNRSQKVQNLNLALMVDTSKVEIDQTQVSVANLSPGATQIVTVNLTGKMEARFEESPLEIQTAQNELQFAMNEKSVMTIIRKHSPTADSKGLILSSNLAQGAGKKLFALDKYDTWDLRVDGAIVDLAKLDSYKTKVIHILADENSQVDAATVATLKQFIDKNGSVSIWGSRLDRSQLGQSLARLAGIGAVSAQNLVGDVLGLEKLKGLTLPVRGVVTVLKAETPKATYVLNSSVGALGLITAGNGIDERTGQVMTVGLDMMDLSDESVKQVLSAYETIRLPYEAKMKLVMDNPKANINLIYQDLSDEMMAAELTGNGNFYKNNDERNKIFRAGKKFIGDAGRKSAQALELSKLYPSLMNIVNTRLNKEKWRAELVLEKRHGSFLNARSIKDIFCENNVSNALCQRDPSN